MKTAKYLAGLLAAFSLSSQGVMAQETKCISRQEISAVGVYLLPTALEASIRECTAFLPSNAALLVKGPGKMEAYNTASKAAKNLAGKTISAHIPSELPPALSQAFALPLVEAMLNAEMAGNLDADSCVKINNIWSPLSSLDPANMGNAIAGILLAALDSDDTKEAITGEETSPIDDLKICPFTLTAKG